MRKLIDIPEEAIKPLKIMAVNKGVSFKRFIEELLIDKSGGLTVPDISGSLLSEKQNYEIAKKFYNYCLIDQNDKAFIGANAIPKIFDECMKVLASNYA